MSPPAAACPEISATAPRACSRPDTSAAKACSGPEEAAEACTGPKLIDPPAAAFVDRKACTGPRSALLEEEACTGPALLEDAPAAAFVDRQACTGPTPDPAKWACSGPALSAVMETVDVELEACTGPDTRKDIAMGACTGPALEDPDDRACTGPMFKDPAERACTGPTLLEDPAEGACTGPKLLEVLVRHLNPDLLSSSFSSSFLVVEHVDEACISPEGVDGADNHTCNRRMQH